MKKIATIMLLLLPSFLIASPEYAISGAGSTSCESFVEHRNDQLLNTVHTTWAQGYLSGLNIADAYNGKDLIAIPDAAAIQKYLLEYCAKNVSDHPVKGATLLYQEIREKQRGKESISSAPAQYSDDAPPVALDALMDMSFYLGCALSGKSCAIQPEVLNAPGRAIKNTSTRNDVECVIDAQCGVSAKCIKAPSRARGECMRVVDEFGLYAPGSAGEKNIQRCNDASSCPVGFHCDTTKKACLRTVQ